VADERIDNNLRNISLDDLVKILEYKITEIGYKDAGIRYGSVVDSC
jgi:hypothetical protein